MIKSTKNSVPRKRRRIKLATVRPWVQTAFLGLWLGPLGLRAHYVPGCVFHCYACPLASFACPIGILGQYSALHLVPVLAIGVLLLVGALVGSLACGWACPFGFLQDLLAKIPTPKFRIPTWMGAGRFLTLFGLVIAVPYFWGEKSPLFFCALCPTGAIESRIMRSALGYPNITISVIKWTSALIFLAMALFAHRPWCSIFCPLGAIFAVFNRYSIFYLKFKTDSCSECNLCRSRCKYGVKIDQSINNSACIRCLECTTCPAIKPAIVKPTIFGRTTS